MNNTYKEIKGQYDALARTVEYMESKREAIKKFYADKMPKSLVFIGSGSSYDISQSAELIAKVRLGIEATSLPAGDIMINCKSYSKLIKNSLIVAISRSGSTSEIIGAIKAVKVIGNIPVIGVTCIAQSELCKISDLVLELPWAFDESVCQTRTVTNFYTIVALLAAYWADDNRLVSDIKSVISVGNDFMQKNESSLKEIAETAWDNAVILADGELQGLSAEAALAFTEISQIPAVYHHLLDVRHGPMVLIDQKTIVIARLTCNGWKYQKELLVDIAAKGSKIIALTDDDCEIPECVRFNIPVSKDLDYVSTGILFIFISQIIAYYKAIQKGLNPDKPDGLDAWIKL